MKILSSLALAVGLALLPAVAYTNNHPSVSGGDPGLWPNDIVPNFLNPSG